MAPPSFVVSLCLSMIPKKLLVTSRRDMRALHLSLISAFCPVVKRNKKRHTCRYIITDTRTGKAVELKKCGERHVICPVRWRAKHEKQRPLEQVGVRRNALERSILRDFNTFERVDENAFEQQQQKMNPGETCMIRRGGDRGSRRIGFWLAEYPLYPVLQRSTSCARSKQGTRVHSKPVHLMCKERTHYVQD